MPSQRDPGTKSEEAGTRASSLGGPILAIGAFAAGAAMTFVAKRLIDARRQVGVSSDERAVGVDGSKEDLPTVLRRAALDVAVAATGQAAERLRRQSEEAETEVESEPEPAQSSSG
jgi:hypothetical protein